MKFKNNKKGQSQMFWILMVAIIAIIVAVFIILWFKGSGEKAFSNVGDTIDKFGDCDGDDVANYFDECPYDAGVPEFDGCVDDSGPKKSKSDEKKCVDD